MGYMGKRKSGKTFKRTVKKRKENISFFTFFVGKTIYNKKVNVTYNKNKNVLIKQIIE